MCNCLLSLPGDDVGLVLDGRVLVGDSLKVRRNNRQLTILVFF